MKQDKPKIGRYGEDVAVNYLQERGYSIQARNLRLLRHEMDIVAERDGVLIFVEVKTRTNEAFGKGFEQITPQKQQRMARFSQLYLQKQEMERECRFDAISIEIHRESWKIVKIVHFPNAFELG